jgi:hypothetical protein
MFLLALLLAAAQPPANPALPEGTTPEALLPQATAQSPEDEELAMIRIAEQHPLGTVENPIRVGGPEGEHAYLGRLRCADGSTPAVGTRAEAGVGGYGSVVAAYPVTCGAAQSRLVFDMYHEEHVETRAPAGFTLAR